MADELKEIETQDLIEELNSRHLSNGEKEELKLCIDFVEPDEKEIDDFETNELVDELVTRTIDSRQLRELSNSFDVFPINSYDLNLPDKMKFDFFFENFDKITLSQLETLTK